MLRSIKATAKIQSREKKERKRDKETKYRRKLPKQKLQHS
jgi:hypothetical protein